MQHENSSKKEMIQKQMEGLNKKWDDGKWRTECMGCEWDWNGLLSKCLSLSLSFVEKLTERNIREWEKRERKKKREKKRRKSLKLTWNINISEQSRAPVLCYFCCLCSIPSFFYLSLSTSLFLCFNQMMFMKHLKNGSISLLINFVTNWFEFLINSSPEWF